MLSTVKVSWVRTCPRNVTEILSGACLNALEISILVTTIKLDSVRRSRKKCINQIYE